MRSTSFLAVCSLSFLGAGAGCSFETGVPRGAQIRCASDADCPPTLTCSDETDRCVGAAVALPRAFISDALVTAEDTPLAIALDVADADVAATRFEVSAPRAGSLTCNGEGAPCAIVGATDEALVYTPAPELSGTDAFDVDVVVDGARGARATLTVDVTPVNDAPSGIAPLEATGPEDVLLVVNLLSRFGDADVDDELRFDVTDQPAHGAASIADASLVIVVEPNYNGPDDVGVSVCDESDACISAAILVTLTPVNDAPRYVDDGAAPLIDGAEPTDIDLAFEDVDGDPLTLFVVTQPQNGAVVVLTGTTVRFTPSPSAAVLFDSFEVEAFDPVMASASAVINVRFLGAASCALLRNTWDSVTQGTPVDGPYVLDADGGGPLPGYTTWCDMTVDGGGWTLVMASDGTSTWGTFSPLWENTALLDADVTPDLDAPLVRSQKLQSWFDVPFEELLVGLRATSGFWGFVQMSLPAQASVHDVFAAGQPIEIAIGSARVAEWAALVPDYDALADDPEEGINLLEPCEENNQLRVGMITSDQGGCEYNGVGIGLDEGGAGYVETGGAADLTLPAALFVRSRDFSALGSAASCAEHAQRGAVLAGIYLIDTPDGPQPTACP